MQNETDTHRPKGSYFRPPTEKPYAWLLYLYICLFLGSFFGDLGKVLALFPWLALIVQVVTNAVNMFRRTSNLDLPKIAINIALFIVLGLMWGLLGGPKS
jgi:hypothetical protein